MRTMRAYRFHGVFVAIVVLSLPVLRAQEEIDTPAKRREAAIARSPFRVLEAPEGAEYHGHGARSGSGDHDEWYQRIGTDLSAAAVVRHFGEQLETRGWVLGAETIEGSVAFRTFRFQDKEGQPWHALLFASEEVVLPGRVRLTLRQTRLVSDD